MLSILIHGICGQMGRAVYAACNASNGEYVAAAGVDMSPALKADEFNCPVYRTLDEVKTAADVIIDFSVPAALPELLRFAQRQKTPVIIGTTGLTERDMHLIHAAAERVPVFQTGNLSLGVNLQLELAKTATATLGEDFDVEIIEKHHNKKIDAPSGTALMLANAIASQRTDDVEYTFGRHEKNKRRTKSELGMHSIRGGTIVGEHEVLFIGNDEIVEITHKAYSKQVFVRGVLRAAKFLQGKQTGFYNMQNLVTEHEAASHISMLEKQAVATVTGVPVGNGSAARVFELVAQQGVNVDMIALTVCSENNCCIGFSCAGQQFSDAQTALHMIQSEFPQVQLRAHPDVVKLTVEGAGMPLRHGIAARLLSVLSDAEITLQMITTSETKIELCVNTIDATRAISEIREKLLQE